MWIKTRDIRDAVVTAAKLASTLDFAGKTFKVDTISESTAAAGVTVDGVLLKDGLVSRASIPAAGFKIAVIAGGAAGDHTVTGITTADDLLEVLYFAGGGVDITDVSDLAGEFAISGADTINNGGGTNTTGGKLVVRYLDRA